MSTAIKVVKDSMTTFTIQRENVSRTKYETYNQEGRLYVYYVDGSFDEFGGAENEMMSLSEKIMGTAAETVTL